MNALIVFKYCTFIIILKLIENNKEKKRSQNRVDGDHTAIPNQVNSPLFIYYTNLSVQLVEMASTDVDIDFDFASGEFVDKSKNVLTVGYSSSHYHFYYYHCLIRDICLKRVVL